MLSLFSSCTQQLWQNHTVLQPNRPSSAVNREAWLISRISLSSKTGRDFHEGWECIFCLQNGRQLHKLTLATEWRFTDLTCLPPILYQDHIPSSKMGHPAGPFQIIMKSQIRFSPQGRKVWNSFAMQIKCSSAMSHLLQIALYRLVRSCLFD